MEEFISELIDRADRAERELNLSRTQVMASHQTQDLPKKVNQDTSYVQCPLLIQIKFLCCEMFFCFLKDPKSLQQSNHRQRSPV